MRTLCKHYDILDPVMSDRSSSQPLHMSESGDSCKRKVETRASNPLVSWLKASEEMLRQRQHRDNKLLELKEKLASLEQERLLMVRERHQVALEKEKAEAAVAKAAALVLKYEVKNKLIALELSNEELAATMSEL